MWRLTDMMEYLRRVLRSLQKKYFLARQERLRAPILRPLEELQNFVMNVRRTGHTTFPRLRIFFLGVIFLWAGILIGDKVLILR